MAKADSTVAPTLQENFDPSRQTLKPLVPSVEDVAMYLECCSDGFEQLAAIFKAIAKEAERDFHIRALADAGRYIADDLANTSDCWREEVRDNGVINKVLGS